MSTLMKEALPVAFSVASRTLIDYVDPDTGFTVNSLENLDSLRSRYPDADISTSWDAAQRLIEKEFYRAPERIERQAWIDSFGSHRDLVRRGRTESFKSSEQVFGEIAVIYARDDFRFFRLYDRADLTHDQIMAMCRAARV